MRITNNLKNAGSLILGVGMFSGVALGTVKAVAVLSEKSHPKKQRLIKNMYELMHPNDI